MERGYTTRTKGQGCGEVTGHRWVREERESRRPRTVERNGGEEMCTNVVLRRWGRDEAMRVLYISKGRGGKKAEVTWRWRDSSLAEGETKGTRGAANNAVGAAPGAGFWPSGSYFLRWGCGAQCARTRRQDGGGPQRSRRAPLHRSISNGMR